MQVHLARKWRSKRFDEVVGQEIPLRLIKNSLYRNIFFPVYLFAGMRGCGKTTLARLFATAINCQELPAFMQNPQQVVLPCLECPSCKAMSTLQHPDFVEIDAASHTGVDNVRALIDAASFVPALGRKKIYLIDEAHMLSKAAFNALLKVLEEPPASVIFMLATTDFHKILDTVRSRCFQLFFAPIASDALAKHLAFVCAQERIAYEPEALAVIAQESEGSARDALNMLERVRLNQAKVTKTAVIQSLGFISDEQLLAITKAVCAGDRHAVLSLCSNYGLKHHTATLFLRKYVEVLRTALWLKMSLVPDTCKHLHQSLKDVTASVSVDTLLTILERCYEHELIINKTTTPGIMLEVMLLSMCVGSTPYPDKVAQEKIVQEKKTSNVVVQNVTSTVIESPSAGTQLWDLFIKDIQSLNEPLLCSILQQAYFIQHNKAANQIEIAFAKNSLFYKEWIEGSQAIWKPALEKLWGTVTLLVVQAAIAPTIKKPEVPRQPTYTQPTVAPSSTVKPVSTYGRTVQKEAAVQVTDAWPQALLLTRFFPGTVTYRADKKEN